MRRLRVLVFLLLVGCQSYPDSATVNLAKEWRLARVGSLVAGHGAMGRPAYRAYLGPALQADLDGDWARRNEGEQREHAIGFFLYRAEPLLLSLAAKGGQPVTFHCGDRELGKVDFSSTRQTEWKLEAEDLKPGWNWIDISAGRELAIRQCQIQPWPAPVSYPSRATPAAGPVGDSGLQLPFGQTVEYAITSPGRSELSLEVELWMEEGASQPAPGDYSLEYTVESEKGESQSWSRTEPGPVRQPLELSSERFALRLQCRWLDSERPLPGQLGLRLKNPRVLRSQLPPVQTTPGLVKRVKPPRKSNVVLLVVDTLRADRLSVYGYQHPTSPNLEALAKDAVVFEDPVAQAPWTKPSVASILTGLEPNQHQTLDFGDALDPRHQTWAEVLTENGYETLGVVANPLLSETFQYNQGFKTYEVLDIWKNALAVTERGLNLMEKRDASKPFFLYLQPIDPHLPYTPPPTYRDLSYQWHKIEHGPGPHHPLLSQFGSNGFRFLSGHLYRSQLAGKPATLPPETHELVQALYDGEVATSDAAVGVLVKWLKEHDLYDDTLIVITSDHGEEVLDRGMLGHLHSLYQELLKVPLVIKFPDGRLAGTRHKQRVSQVDILPTVLDELGLPAPENIDGRPVQADQNLTVETMSEVNVGGEAVATGQAVIEFLELGWCLESGPYKFIRHDSSRRPNSTPRALYDLVADPGERRNLILDRPVLGLFLETELARRRSRPVPLVPEKASPKAVEDSMRALQYL